MSLHYWAEYGMYDKVYYRINDKISIELDGDGRINWYKTNERTHRVHQSGSYFCDKLPLFCYQRPNTVNWV